MSSHTISRVEQLKNHIMQTSSSSSSPTHPTSSSSSSQSLPSILAHSSSSSIQLQMSPTVSSSTSTSSSSTSSSTLTPNALHPSSTVTSPIGQLRAPSAIQTRESFADLRWVSQLRSLHHHHHKHHTHTHTHIWLVAVADTKLDSLKFIHRNTT